MRVGLRRRKWGRFCGFHGISLPVNQFDLKSWAEQSFCFYYYSIRKLQGLERLPTNQKTLLQFSGTFAAFQQNLGI